MSWARVGQHRVPPEAARDHSGARLRRLSHIADDFGTIASRRSVSEPAHDAADSAATGVDLTVVHGAAMVRRMTASTERVLRLGFLSVVSVLAACGDDGASGIAEDGGMADGHDSGLDERDVGDAGDGSGDAQVGDGGDEPSDGGPDGGMHSTLTPSQLCSRLRAEADEWFCAQPSIDDCDAILDAASERCQVVVDAVEAGRLAFDADAAQACLDDLTTSQLGDAFSSRYLPCEEVFIGRIEPGEDCFFDYGFVANECVPSAYCSQGSACPGTCKPYRTKGQSCGSDGPCAPELACKRDCQPPCDGTCEPRPGAGEDCEATQGLCQSGLICDATTDPYSCLDPLPNGEACTRPYQCASFWCDDGECAPRPTAQCEDRSDCDDDELCDRSSGVGMCEPARGEGEACDDAPDCQDGLQCLFNWSGGDSKCVASAGEDGDPCLPWGCEPDHYCADESGELTCRPVRGMGETCEEPSNELPLTPSCEPGLHCMLSSSGTCLPPGGMGEPCYYNDVESCEHGLVCFGYAASSCQPPSMLGEACNPAFENACTEGYCRCEMVDDSCTWSCEAQLENGEPCDDPTMCESGYCDLASSPAVCADEPGPATACLPE